MLLIQSCTNHWQQADPIINSVNFIFLTGLKLDSTFFKKCFHFLGVRFAITLDGYSWYIQW